MKPRIRASELDRILRCPGSRILTSIVERQSGPVAWEGTSVHHEIAWRLANELGAEQPDGGLLRPKDLPVGYRMPAYVAWIVPWCFNIVRDDVPLTWALDVEPELVWEFDRWILSGHLDVAGTSPDGKESKDFDWKCGRIPVDPAECNEQVGGYIALRRLIYGIERAKFTIGQPWNAEEDGFERISTVTVDGAEALDRLVTTLDHRVCAALDDAMRLETGPSQCRYCVGLSCPALGADLEFMKMTLTPELLATIRAKPESGQLVDLVAMARTLSKPIEDAEDILKKRLESEPVLTGNSGVTARIKESSGGFQVVDPVGMFNWLSEQMKPEQLAPCLGYPGVRIKTGLAKALSIPETGKAPVTAKTVFEGGAAPFIEQRTKKQLILQ